MELIRCDYCKKEASEYELLVWYTVEHERMTLFEEMYPKHFDTTKCLSEYFHDVWMKERNKSGLTGTS